MAGFIRKNFSAIDIYVCYNQITYVVACEHATATATRSKVIAFDGERVVRQGRYADLNHIDIRHRYSRLKLLSMVVSFSTALYVPHLRGGRLIKFLAASAQRIILIDDGLDTLRDVPKNIGYRDIRRVEGLITFRDYRVVGSWARDLPISAVCPLSTLADDERPTADLTGLKVVIVESPGVHGDSVLRDLNSVSSEVGFFPHSNVRKRLIEAGEFRLLDGKQNSIERSLAGFQGTVITGASMVTVFLLHCHPDTRMKILLQREDFLNLSSMHLLLECRASNVFIDAPRSE